MKVMNEFHSTYVQILKICITEISRIINQISNNYDNGTLEPSFFWHLNESSLTRQISKPGLEIPNQDLLKIFMKF